MTEKERELRKENKTLREYLTLLVDTVEPFIAQIDAEMKKPAGKERDGRIAKLINVLELNKDRAKRYGLGRDWDGKPLPKPGQQKKRSVKKPKS